MAVLSIPTAHNSISNMASNTEIRIDTITGFKTAEQKLAVFC